MSLVCPVLEKDPNCLVMSWFRDSTLNLPQLICAKILKCGVIPQHVAFIMDGNRRYAKQNKVKKLDGHSKG